MTSQSDTTEASLVVLVDEQDNEIGVMEKLAAHEPPGRLHRAISVMAIDDEGRMLLHRRATAKYHFGGRWTNTCCSHPMPGEHAEDAGVRRLREEMGIEAPCREVGTFLYTAHDPEGGLIERELDHVLVTNWSGEPKPDPAEADAWRWISPGSLDDEIAADAARFSPWLPYVLGVLRDSGAIGC